MTNSTKNATPAKGKLNHHSSGKPKARFSILMYADLHYEEYVKDELFIANFGTKRK